ncbi:MAG TPA: LptF/LptG family permease [Candidatus Eisenbacteria bacterium]
MRILRTYILRLHLVPFLLGFGVVTFILEMDVLFDYLDLVVNRGVAVGVVAQLFLLSLGYIVALSAPCAVLIAALMTFGRLSQDNEITALRASGVNLGTILLGPLAASVALAVGLTLFNNHVLPETNHAFANLLIDIGRMRPTVRLQEGVFITDFPGYNLLVQSVNGRTNEMRGVTIYKLNPGGAPTTILARRGTLTYTPDGRTAVLKLRDGEIHEIPTEEGGPRKYRRMVFSTHVIYIPGAGGLLEHSVRDTRGDREMSAQALIEERAGVRAEYERSVREHVEQLRIAGAPQAALESLDPDRQPWRERLGQAWAALTRREDPLDRLVAGRPDLRPDVDAWRMERDGLRRRIAGLSVEIHKKFSLPAACVVFVLLGAPLGMRVRRAGPAVAFVSIAFFLFYYLCLIGGEELANRLLLPPWLSMWLPNLALGTWGAVATLQACDLGRRSAPAMPRHVAGSAA